jgi:REP element-mobilizing transposase RayT
MARGIDGTDIFRDDEDRTTFLALFEKYSAVAGVRCYAWALMGNHYHFVIRTSDRPLASLMKPLNSRYAAYFNKKMGRRGYLFQDRFKSVATQDQLYLEEMIRYVHLNPVRAGVCKTIDSLDKYRWCGHAALLGVYENRFQDTATVLRRFGGSNTEARRKYRVFLQAGIVEQEDTFVNRIRSSSAGTNNRTEPGMWVIGDAEFVKQATAIDTERRLRIAQHAREGWDTERVCRRVAKKLGIEPESILQRGRGDTRSSARKIVAYVAHRTFEIPVLTIARHLGIGQPAVSAMLAEGERLARDLGVSIND